MSAAEVEALRGELSKLNDRAAKNGPSADAASVNLRTDARGRVDSITLVSAVTCDASQSGLSYR